MLTVTPRGRLKTISRRAGKRGARATRPPSLVSALCARHALQCLQVGIVRSWLRSLAMHFDWLVYSLGRADGRRRSANQHTTLGRDTLAERSKAVAQGAIPKGRGFEPHRCHFSGMPILVVWAARRRLCCKFQCFCKAGACSHLHPLHNLPFSQALEIYQKALRMGCFFRNF